MKRKITRLITLMLIFCFLVASFNTFFAFEFAEKDTKLPSNIKWIDPDTNLRLNLSLYKDLGLVVYGDHKIIDEKKQDFKSKANGYYTNDKGERGEYRYHGYTLGGSIYANANFPEDQVMTRGENTYRYIPHIWEEGTPYYNLNRLPKSSKYTEIAVSNDPLISTPRKSQYRTRINAAAPYTLTNPLYLYNGGKDFYNYANVETMPTYFNSGDFRL